MINYLGEWKSEEDYKALPKEKWCDLDYVADYIKENGYKPKTSIENLAVMIVLHFGGENEDNDSFFTPAYNENCMINIDMVSAFVEASGGLSEFDYEC